ncbi:MAG: undecaprenyl-diphosphate phosphatase [Spirochaetales bacterium]|nr:undecaprenyl-diphosphate phosphatase [Spirochaetales bacterium]
MSVLQSVLLGIIQGIAEFLPVSSSGHLFVLENWMGLSEVPKLYDILLHVATLAAIIIVFRKQVWKLLKGFFLTLAGKGNDEDRIYFRVALIIILATIITFIPAVFIEKIDLGRAPRVVSLLFLLTAIVLFLVRKSSGDREISSLNWKDALAVGLAQGLAVFPGISRSGFTISAFLFRGISRKDAGELSFLLSIPAILGAAVWELRDSGALMDNVSWPALLLGLAAAFGFGLISLLLLLRLIRKGKLYYFCFYLVPAAVLSFIIL